MPLDAPSEYGASLGPYRKIPKQDAALSLVQGGLNLVVSTDDLAEGETPDATDVRLDQGGVSSDYALAAFNYPAGLLQDSATRADSGTLGSADTGQAWTEDGSFNIGVQSNHLAATGASPGNAFPHLQGWADGTITCKITISPTANRANVGVIFRKTDANHFLLVSLSTAVGINPVRLWKNNAGYSSLAESATPVLVPGTTYTLTVVLSGNTITVSLNGTQYISYTLAGGDIATFGTQSLIGLWMGQDPANDDGQSFWDDFTMTSAFDRNIMGVFPFELDTATKLMVRVRPTKIDRWNGTNWFEVPGTMTGTYSDRIYTAVSQGKFVIANGVDKLKSWNGNDATSIADLSADSPIARFITRIGNRLLAANIKVAGVFDQNALAWTTDGNITDWTTANNGAGGTSLLPEGSDKSAGFITGLGTVEGGAVIFRQKGLQIGSLTGIGAAPFRFTTVDFQHGTESPYSICSGGIRSGVYWLGEDYMVYHFDGRSTPTAIGIPIADALRTAVADRRNVLGAVNAKHQELWIGVPTSNDGLIKIAYIFSIREWARTGRLVWRKRSLGAGYRGLGFGYVPTSADPIVDTVSSIVDSVTIRVDDFANTQADERILLGDTVGQVYSLDTSTALTTGIWTSRSIGDGVNDITVDLVTLTISATTAGSVEVAGSLDGGTTWSNPKTIVVSGPCKSLAFSDVLDLTGNKMQFRLRILSGFLLISKIAYTYDDRGRTR